MEFRTIEYILEYQKKKRMKESQKHMEYSNPNICRLFLARICPHTLFKDTVKRYKDRCPKIHSVHLREAYEIAELMCKVSYDRDVEDTLLKIVKTRDLTYEDSFKRLGSADAEVTRSISVLQITQNQEVLLLANYIEQYSSIADKHDLEAINAEDVEMADEAMQMRNTTTEQKDSCILERAVKEAKLLLDALKKVGKRERGSSSVKTDCLVCDVCGTLFDVRYSESHFLEQLHQGYLKIHYRLIDIQFERKARSESSSIEEKPDLWWNEIDRRLLEPPPPLVNQEDTSICWTVSPADSCSAFLSQEGEAMVLSPTPLVDTGCSSTRSTFIDRPYRLQTAFEHIKEEGLPLTSDVPFSTVKFPAGWRWDASQVKIGTRKIPNYTRIGVDEESIISWLRFNSVVVHVEINANDGQEIFMGLKAYQVGRDRTKHAVVLDSCGYDPSTNLNFFGFRNSSGKGWGEDGYGKMVRKSSMPPHRCPIIVDAYAPSFIHW